MATFGTRNAAAPMLGASDAANLRTEISAIVADLAALRAAILVITAQLDADAGVTDTDYAANADPVANTAVALTAG